MRRRLVLPLLQNVNFYRNPSTATAFEMLAQYNSYNLNRGMTFEMNETVAEYIFYWN